MFLYLFFFVMLALLEGGVMLLTIKVSGQIHALWWSELMAGTLIIAEVSNQLF